MKQSSRSLRRLLSTNPPESAARNRRLLECSTHIHDDALLRRLLILGMRVETMPAFQLVPLVAVGWADGRLDRHEHKVVCLAAEHAGICSGSSAHAVLECWVGERPVIAYFQVWTRYIEALREVQPPDEYSATRQYILGWSTAVGRASGGILGFRVIGKAQRRVLARIEQAFA